MIIYDQTVTPPRGRKIQGWSAHYDKWLLNRLVELGLETSENALVARIVREWIERNAEKHAALGLTAQVFFGERQAPGAKLFSFPKNLEREGPKHKPDKPDPEEATGRRLGLPSVGTL